ncbi:hypothetical protein [Pararhodospirillum photometricum]|uniref:hypothetical protein n=1 Tax=Pararhodospirillum photometricum TaxID=1084 RepID=UPI00059F78FA|nr:hypothetical protein [Pararhodospirillum photometricum]
MSNPPALHLRLGEPLDLPTEAGAPLSGTLRSYLDLGRYVVATLDTSAGRRQALLARERGALRVHAHAPSPAEARRHAEGVLAGRLACDAPALALAVLALTTPQGPVSGLPDLTRGHDALDVIAQDHPERLPGALRVLTLLATLPGEAVPPIMQGH